MGLFWTSEVERKEKEIRDAVNSIKHDSSKNGYD